MGGYNGTTAVVQAGFLNRPKFVDDLKSFRANLSGDIDGSLFRSWEVGGNYSRRKKTSAYTSYFLCPPGGGTNCTVASGTPTSAPVPDEAMLGSNVSLGYLGVPAMLTLDPLYLYDNVLNAVYDNRPSSLVRDNVVKEDVYTGYAKLNIDGELGGKPLRGAIGVQVITRSRHRPAPSPTSPRRTARPS
jgi:iron complex outermembrane receptor protein